MANIGTGERQNRLPGFQHAWSLVQLRELLMRARAASGGSFRICFHPRGKNLSDFAAVCRLVELARNTVFVVDEIWHFCRASWMPPELEAITFTGRMPGVTVLYTAQQPARIATGLRSIATQVHVFRVNRRDFDSIKYDFDIPEEMAGQVMALPDRARVVRDERMGWARA